MRDISLYEDDFLLDTTVASSFESIAKSLPNVVTRGSTLIVQGKPQFKAAPRILCPRCEVELSPGTATVKFRHASIQTAEQSVDALVCECGEVYIQGQDAKEAYLRAMHGDPSGSKTHDQSTPVPKEEPIDPHAEQRSVTREDQATSATASVTLLLERWREGDEEAADEIHRRYSQRLCALAEHRIGTRLARRLDADDIVQSVFATFFQRARDGQFSIDHSASLWHLLVRITLNKIHRETARVVAARRDVLREDYPRDLLEPEAVAHEPDPTEAAILSDEVEAILARLGEHEVEIMRHCLEGYSTSETASLVGCSRWTVRRVLDRIGRDLKTRLVDTYET